MTAPGNRVSVEPGQVALVGSASIPIEQWVELRNETDAIVVVEADHQKKPFLIRIVKVVLR